MPAPRKYPDELRERAVRLVFESGRPIAQVARDLGVHKEALRGTGCQGRLKTGFSPIERGGVAWFRSAAC